MGQQRLDHAASSSSTLLDDFLKHAEGKELFAQDLYGGADPAHRVKARVFTEYAWHSLFIRNLLIRPDASELAGFVPDMTIVDLPSFKADPARHGCRSETVIAFDFTRKIVLIGGTVLCRRDEEVGLHLPELHRCRAQGVMPMHCSANVGDDGDVGDLLRPLRHRQDDAVERSRTAPSSATTSMAGAATASSTSRAAATPRPSSLSREAEPEIYATTERFGTVLENVVFDPVTRVPGFRRRLEDREHALRLSARLHPERLGDRPRRPSEEHRHADRRRLRRAAADRQARRGAEAMYHFLSGYTAKVAGTEKGLTEPEATFSTCFGAPVHAAPSLASTATCCATSSPRHHVDCWLVNTGWTGGGVRRRPAHADPRHAPPADGGARRLARPSADFRRDPYFGFAVPTSVPGVEPHILYPVKTWQDKAAFAETAKRLRRHVPARTSRASRTMSTPTCGPPRPHMSIAAMRRRPRVKRAPSGAFCFCARIRGVNRLFNLTYRILVKSGEGGVRLPWERQACAAFSPITANRSS